MKSDAEFAQAWADSQHRVAMVAVWFAQQEMVQRVEIPPWKIRLDVRDRAASADRGDLIVDGYRVEVKGRMGDPFDSVESFPYPDVIVCEQYTWDQMAPKITCFCIVNSAETGFLKIYGSTVRRMGIHRNLMDRSLNEKRDFVLVPKRLATYHSFQEAA